MEKYPVKIIHSNRRSISLSISDELEIIAKAPYLTPNSVIRKMIQDNKAWILKNIKQRNYSNSKRLKFEVGEKIPILGIDCLITVNIAIKKTFINPEKAIIEIPSSDIPKLKIINAIKRYAHNFYSFKIDYYSKIMGLNYKKMKLSSGCKTLGSCNANQTINLSWKTIFYPEFVSDYIIIHELAHLRELNHSKRFWAIVKQFSPNYKEIRRYIKKNSHLTQV